MLLALPHDLLPTLISCQQDGFLALSRRLTFFSQALITTVSCLPRFIYSRSVYGLASVLTENANFLAAFDCPTYVIAVPRPEDLGGAGCSQPEPCAFLFAACGRFGSAWTCCRKLADFSPSLPQVRGLLLMPYLLNAQVL